MAIVVPIFLRADFEKMFHYLTKKARARAVKKVRLVSLVSFTSMVLTYLPDIQARLISCLGSIRLPISPLSNHAYS